MSSEQNGVEYLDYIPCKQCIFCLNYSNIGGKKTCTPGYGKLEYSGKEEAASTIARKTGKKTSVCEHFVSKLDTGTITKNKLLNISILLICILIAGLLLFLSNPVLFIKKFWFLIVIATTGTILLSTCKSICVQDYDKKKNHMKYTLLSLVSEIMLVVGNLSFMKQYFSVGIVIFYIVLCFILELMVIPMACDCFLIMRDFFRMSKGISIVLSFIALMLGFFLINYIVGAFLIIVGNHDTYLKTSPAVSVD